MKKKRNKSFKAESERVAKQRRMRPIIKRVIRAAILLIVTILIYLIFWLNSAGYFQRMADNIAQNFYNFSMKMNLIVENIHIEGLDNLTKKDVISVLPKFNDDIPMLALPLNEIKESLKNLGWVKSASIGRNYPNSLHIQIIERKPRAIWQNGGDLKLIDLEGHVILDKPTDEADFIIEFTDLPVIVGNDANIHLAYLLNFMDKEPSLISRVSSIIRVGNRRWDVRMNNALKIKLPENNPEKSWHYLAQIHNEKQILDRDIKSIDLRVENRLFILPTDN